MDILIGTTNPAKINRFSNLLSGCDVRILTPADFNIHGEPKETGKNPLENACIKASFYAEYHPYVICNDSGLYFSDLAFDDPRQPGLHIRTPNGVRLNDEQMIAHYSSLAKELGGKISAYYLDTIAVSADGKVSVYRDSEKALQDGSFYLLGIPSPRRTPGWPLDSLSVNKQTGFYFVDGRSNTSPSEARIQALHDQRNFLLSAFSL